jgi:hypothetical protein
MELVEKYAHQNVDASSLGKLTSGKVGTISSNTSSMAIEPTMGDREA